MEEIKVNNLGNEYNEDYYEKGLESGVSCYQNYRWIPELTFPMAMAIIDYLDIKSDETILDFGCAKGYLVKALRLLRRQAWGYDVSKYAIDKCDSDVKEFCFLRGKEIGLPLSFDYVIAKDVLEHIDEGRLDYEVGNIGAKRLFAVIPLGDSETYRAPINNCDRTHKICASEFWWIKVFDEMGWKLEDLTYKIEGIKDHYYEKFPMAHGFFLFKNRNPRKREIHK